MHSTQNKIPPPTNPLPDKLETAESKSHWSHSDSFSGGEHEYIKAFVHSQYAIGYHTHSFYELNIVINGKGRHYIEEMSCEAKPGCVFIIPPHVRHGYINHGDLDVYHVLIHRDFLTLCFAEFRHTTGYSLLFEIEPYLRAQYPENMFLILSEPELQIALQDLQILAQCEAMADADLYKNAITKKLIAYLCMLISQHRGMEESVPQSRKELKGVADCLNYIHQNFEETLTIEQLAQEFHMSRSTLIRHFTKICGVSPHQYIRQYRLQKAREYLKEPGTSFAAIASQCGFYDASHLRKSLNDQAKRFARE